jgi:hypothetical protein
MTMTLNQSRLLSHLANMIALEAAIELRLDELIPKVAGHEIASTLLADFRALSRDHRQALETRLTALTDRGPPSDEMATIYAADNLPDVVEYPVSSSLQEIYTLYNQALFSYGMLGSLSSRSLDSWVIADEGTSAHLALQYINDYVEAIQKISRLINDVLLWELEGDGVECQCLCPSCNTGICLCSAYWRKVLSDAWLEAGPIATDAGIYVQHPKQGSVAAAAGLVRGDVILAAEGDTIESPGDMQSAVRSSQPGEIIKLTVRRPSDELEDIVLVHP